MKKKKAENMFSLKYAVRNLGFILSLAAFILTFIYFQSKPASQIALIMMYYGIALILIFFAYHSVNEEDIERVYAYKPQPPTAIAVKWVAALLLIVAGVVADQFKLPLLMYLCFIASAILAASTTVITQASQSGAGLQLLPATDLRSDAVTVVVIAALTAVAAVLLKKAMLLYGFTTLIIAALFMMRHFNRNTFTDDDNRLTRPDMIMLGIIGVVTLFFYFFRFDQVPPGVQIDYRAPFYWINIGIHKATVFITDANIFSSTFELNLVSILMKIFGNQVSTSKIYIILTSIASIPLFFLLVREMFDKKTAMFTTVFFTLGFLPVHFTRVGTAVYTPVFYLLAALYFLLVAIRKGKISYYVIAGAMTALSLYVYHAGKVVPLIVAAAIVIYWLDLRRLKGTMSNLMPVVVFGVSALIVVMPLAVFMFKNPAPFFMKTGGFQTNIALRVFDAINSLIAGQGIEGWTPYNGLAFRPVLVGTAVVFFLVGFMYLLGQFRKRGNQLLLAWMALSVLPNVLIHNNMPVYYFRMITFFPAVCIVTGLGVNVLYRFAVKMTKLSPQLLFMAILALITAETAGITYRDYFVVFANNNDARAFYDYNHYLVENEALKYTKKNRVLVTKYYVNLQAFMFSRVPEKDFEWTNMMDVTPALINGSNKDVVIIAEGLYKDYFNYLKQYYPGTEITVVPNTHPFVANPYEKLAKKGDALQAKGTPKAVTVDLIYPDVAYVVVKIPKKDIDAAIGLGAVYYKNGIKIGADTYRGGSGMAGADRAVLTGSLDLPEYGVYRFDLGKGVSGRVVIDNRAYDGYKLAQGMHAVRIELAGIGKSGMAFNWKHGKGEMEAVPDTAMLKDPVVYGLREKHVYFFNRKDYFEKSVPAVCDRFLWFEPNTSFDPNQQYTVYWDGYYNAPEAGTYSFDLQSHEGFCNSIEIDGREVMSSKSGVHSNAKVKLNRGKHRLRAISYSYSNKPANEMFYHKLVVQKPGGAGYEAPLYYELTAY